MLLSSDVIDDDNGVTFEKKHRYSFNMKGAVRVHNAHIQKVLYIPQAELETIYSLRINYQYSTSAVCIDCNNIKDHND